MRTKFITLLTISPLLMSCSHIDIDKVNLSKIVFYFDTSIEVKFEGGTHDTMGMITGILINIDEVTDNYTPKRKNGVYYINQTHETMIASDYLYDLLKLSTEIKDKGAPNFNPLMGSLAKLWKEAISNKTILSDEVIASELAKINTSSLNLGLDYNQVQRIGDAEIDLGGIVKGYALDKIQDYFKAAGVTNYLVNAGNSSILLGEKSTDDGLFSVGIKDIDNAYFELKNCFVSTSSISNQSTIIDGVVYSHIINPTNGSATPLNDEVIVVSDKGYVGDAFSTSMMNNTIEEIKAIENQYNVKTIVINSNQIEYCHPELEVKYH